MTSTFFNLLNQMKASLQSPDLSPAERKSLMIAIEEMERPRRNRINQEVKSVYDVANETAEMIGGELAGSVIKHFEQLKLASLNRARTTLDGRSVIKVMKEREGLKQVAGSDVIRYVIKYWLEETRKVLEELEGTLTKNQLDEHRSNLFGYLEEREIHFKNNKGGEL